ncbi:MAG: matrixin family metalloprotease [Muribaculaceae bacterium]|nr:matrixin family metalloprotease [Muribaculaceae bacterium]
MKKILSLFILFCLSFVISVNSALADYGWENPKSIRVCIEPNPRKTMMKEAFAKWTSLTNGRLVFKYVESPNNAQIYVKFVKDAAKATRDLNHAIGVTYTTFKLSESGDKVVLNTAVIEIADHAPGSSGRLMPNERISRVMVHEIGHAIGFQGSHEHSADKQSLMYPVAHSRTQVITAADLKFLSSIYGW